MLDEHVWMAICQPQLGIRNGMALFLLIRDPGSVRDHGRWTGMKNQKNVVFHSASDGLIGVQVIDYWNVNVNIAVWISIMIVVIVGLNALPVKFYGETEFW